MDEVGSTSSCPNVDDVAQMDDCSCIRGRRQAVQGEAMPLMQPWTHEQSGPQPVTKSAALAVAIQSCVAG